MTDGGEALNRYLDALARGDETRSVPLDPALISTIGRLNSLDMVPGPTATFIDHLEERLMHMHTNAQTRPSLALSGNGAYVRRPPVWSPPPVAPRPSRRWFSSTTIVAAAILTLVLGLLVSSHVGGWI